MSTGAQLATAVHERLGVSLSPQAAAQFVADGTGSSDEAALQGDLTQLVARILVADFGACGAACLPGDLKVSAPPNITLCITLSAWNAAHHSHAGAIGICCFAAMQPVSCVLMPVQGWQKRSLPGRYVLQIDEISNIAVQIRDRSARTFVRCTDEHAAVSG